jgi:hypothetical protein
MDTTEIIGGDPAGAIEHEVKFSHATFVLSKHDMKESHRSLE